MPGPRVGDAYINITADGKSVDRTLDRIEKQFSKRSSAFGNASGKAYSEAFERQVESKVRRTFSDLSKASVDWDFSHMQRSNETIEQAWIRIRRELADAERGMVSIGGQTRRLSAGMNSAFRITKAQREEIERGLDAWKQTQITLRDIRNDHERNADMQREQVRLIREQEQANARLASSIDKDYNRMIKAVDRLDTRTLSWSKAHRRHVTSALGDWERLSQTIRSVDLDLDTKRSELDRFMVTFEDTAARTDRAARIMGRNLDTTFRGRWRIAMRDAGREGNVLVRTFGRITAAVKAIQVPSFKDLTSRMDSTVRAVIILVAAAAEHVATLASSLASVGTAVLSSVAYALGVVIPLAAGAVAALLGVSLAVSSWESMKETVDGFAESIEQVGSAWTGQAEAFGAAWGPALTTFLDALGRLLEVSNIGSSLGTAFAGITDAFTEVVNGAGMQNFLAALQGPLAAGLQSFGQGLAFITDGILNLLAAAAPGFATLGEMFSGWGERFAETMATMSADGTIAGFVDRAIGAFSDLMGVIGPLGGALANIFNAGEGSGSRLLERLGDLMSTFEEWTGSLQGQNALADWFARGEQIIGPLGDLLRGVGEALNGLVDDATTARLGDLLSGLGEFAPVLGEVLQVISNLDLLGNLVDLLNVLGQAVAPILPILQDLASTIGGAIGGAIQAIAPLLMSLGQALAPVFGILSSVLSAALPPILAIVDALSGALIPIVDALTPVFEQLAPIVAEVAGVLGGALTQVIQALAPLLATLGAAFAPVLTAIGNLVATILPILIPALQQILAAVLPVIDLLVGLLGPALLFIGNLLGQVIGWLAPIVAFIVESVVGNIVGVVQGLSDFIQGIVATIKALFEGDFKGAWEGVKQTVSGAVQAVWNFIQLWFVGKVVKGIGAALKSIGALFSSAWTTIRTGVSGFFTTIKNWFSTNLSTITTTVSTKINSIKTFFSNGWTSIKTAIDNFFTSAKTKFTNGLSDIVTKVKELPGKIATGLSNMVSKGTEIAGNFITGLVNGLSSGAGRVVEAAKNVAKNAWNAVTDFLGIGSPSKLMKDVGRFFDQGFAIGISQESGESESAAAAMAQRAVDAVDYDSMVNAGIAAAEQFANGLTSVGMPNLTADGAVTGAGLANVASTAAAQGSGFGSGVQIIFSEGAIQISTPATNPVIVAEQVAAILADTLANNTY